MAYELSTCMVEGHRMPYDRYTKEALFNGRWWDIDEEYEELRALIAKSNNARDEADDLAVKSRKEDAA